MEKIWFNYYDLRVVLEIDLDCYVFIIDIFDEFVVKYGDKIVYINMG